MPDAPRFDVDAIKGRNPVETVVARYVPLRQRGREFVGLCPFHKEKTPSFTVRPDKGFYHCFGCGAHGDAIRFVMETQGVDFAEACRLLDGPAGPPLPGSNARARPAPARRDDKAAAIARAREIWRKTGPAPGTRVEAYLQARGIDLPPPATLRSYPSLPYWHMPDGNERPVKVGAWPAMVGAILSPLRDLVGVHITWLAWDGTGKAPIEHDGAQLPSRKMRGLSSGCAVRLAPLEGGRLAVAEGIETALSVLGRLHAREPHAGWSAWAALSAPGIRALRVPQSVREVLLCPDGDPAGREAAAEAAKRLSGVGRRVRIADPGDGQDFNDLLTGEDCADA